MKKILVTLFLLIQLCTAYAGGVSKIIMASDSTVYVYTQFENMGATKDSPGFAVSLTMIRSVDHNAPSGFKDSYYLYLSNGSRVFAGQKMLIKTNDDSIIELTNVNGVESSDENPDYKVYPINEKDIQDIVKKGSKKMRYEDAFDFYDYNLEDGRFSRIFKIQYEAIVSMNLNKKYANIYENF